MYITKINYNDEFEEDELADFEAEAIENQYLSDKVDLKYTTLYWVTMGKFGLNLTEAMVMALITGLSKKRGYCNASKQHFANLLHVSRQTIHSCLKNLRAKRLIKLSRKLVNGVRLTKPSSRWLALMRVIKVRQHDLRLQKNNRTR